MGSLLTGSVEPKVSHYILTARTSLGNPAGHCYSGFNADVFCHRLNSLPATETRSVVVLVHLVNSDQIDELEVVAHQSFASRTRSNGPFRFLGASFRARAALQLEILALRHQIGVLQRSVKRPKLTAADRFLWAWLSSVWNGWESRVSIIKAATVIGWQRKGFGLFWSWKIRRGKPGRPALPKEIRELIRMLSRENPLWGAPHIHGELLKLGINISETSVSKYMVRRRKPPSQTWRTFLDN